MHTSRVTLHDACQNCFRRLLSDSACGLQALVSKRLDHMRGSYKQEAYQCCSDQADPAVGLPHLVQN
eukprot:3578492-Amphidinium_carterae.1